MLKNQSKQPLTKMGAHHTSKVFSCTPNCKSHAQEETDKWSKCWIRKPTLCFIFCLNIYLAELIINLATGWSDPPKCIFFYFKKCFKEKASQSSPSLSPLIDTSILCELPSEDTSFPKEQQEILQSSYPYFFIFYFLPVKIVWTTSLIKAARSC